MRIGDLSDLLEDGGGGSSGRDLKGALHMQKTRWITRDIPATSSSAATTTGHVPLDRRKGVTTLCGHFFCAALCNTP